MAWITVAQADTILVGASLDELWRPVADANKLKHVQGATNRLEAIPFKSDAQNAAGLYLPRLYGRYVDGFVPDGVGAVTAQPIPPVLAYAVAFLAAFLQQHPVDDFKFEEGIADTLSAHLQGIPIEVQRAIWSYIIDEYKGIDFLSALTEEAVAAAEEAGDPARIPPLARPIDYVDTLPDGGAAVPPVVVPLIPPEPVGVLHYFGWSVDRMITTEDLALANAVEGLAGALPDTDVPRYAYFASPAANGYPASVIIGSGGRNMIRSYPFAHVVRNAAGVLYLVGISSRQQAAALSGKLVTLSF